MAPEPEFTCKSIRTSKSAPSATAVSISVVIRFEKPLHHINSAQLTQRFAACAKLYIIIWCRRCRAEQSIYSLAHEICNRLACRSVEIFENAALVAHYALEIVRIEMMQSLVVRDYDPVTVF